MQGKRIKMKKILFILILLTSTVNAAYVGIYGTFNKPKTIDSETSSKVGVIPGEMSALRDGSNKELGMGFYVKIFKESYDDWPIGFETSYYGTGYDGRLTHPEGGSGSGYVRQEHSNINLMLAYSLYNEFSSFKIKTNLLFGYTETGFSHYLERQSWVSFKGPEVLIDEDVSASGMIYGFDTMIFFPKDHAYMEFDLYGRKYSKDVYIKAYDKSLKIPLEYSVTIGVYDESLVENSSIGFTVGLKYKKLSTFHNSNGHTLGLDLSISF